LPHDATYLRLTRGLQAGARATPSSIRHDRRRVCPQATYDKGATSEGAEGPSTNVSVCRYFYGEDAEARRAEGEPRWRQWLGETFGAKEPQSTDA
jgi:hypothetical protein